MKSFLVLVLAVVGAISPALAEKVATMPAPTGYVDDYAGVMTASSKADVEAICREVHDKTSAQIFFVTVKSLEGESVDTFSNDLFHNWKIGEKKTDRGILVLLAVEDHKRRIEVGYGLEGILPDAKAGDIGREMVPALRDSNYDEAARVSVTAIADVIAADARVSLDSTAVTTAPSLSDQPPPAVQVAPSSSDIMGLAWVMPVFFFAVFIAFFGFIGLIIWRSIRNGARIGGGGTGFYGGGGDSFGGSSGGTSGGGSDSFSGGGSDSFSGGGGGDSGGGGASGDW